ncbi:heavy metal translocating P-type ATPase [Halomarina oriensis]|uniref:Cadmium-translocating P-type ATPase n=1 Tax=Halomarina oriensis TaxID=671145 RepID=A0A6B0GUH0_9EURY|nr:heavy metal translocating P-type ATPase [Halomarina oriensis]MWG35368.1 cadmium-translocating P-type ATPase [Halomarina oriensis]
MTDESPGSDTSSSGGDSEQSSGGHGHDHNHDRDHSHSAASNAAADERLDGDTTVELSVPEMDCASCAKKVESSVRKLEGIESVDPQVTSGRLRVGYNDTQTDADAITDRVEKAGYTVEASSGPQSVRFDVPDMDCASCAGKVENALGSVSGIHRYDTQPTSGTVQVEFDEETVSRRQLVDAIEGVGYGVTNAEANDEANQTGRSESVWRSKRAIKTWISGVFVGFGLLFEFPLEAANAEVASILGTELLLADVLFLVAVAIGGQTILRNGYYSARNLNLDIDLLMSSAIIGALVASLGFGAALYFEAATLAFLFSVAELLERYSMDKTRNSLRELMDLSPDEATVRRDGEELTVPVDDVRVGEVVLVRPGEKIPMDGEVVNGESAVNQAPITGESVPVDKTTGDEVYAGTVNEGGYLEVKVTSEASDNTISRVVSMVEDAQSNKTDREQFVERFADYYTPIVVTVALAAMVIPPVALGASWTTWFVRGLTLIVLACPCAFVISTPVSVVSGITSAAKNGVLIKGGDHLEAMGEVDAIALDKTGTLTKGELAVTDVVPLNGNSEEDVLRCARGLETRSEHPIGEAIVAQANDRGVADREVDDFESLTGKGVRADLDGEPHFAGKPGLFEELGFDLSHVHATTDGGQVTATTQQLCERNDCLDLLESTVPKLQSEGKTVVLVGTEDELEGVIAVADEVRPDAAAMVERLHDLGVEHVVMLTGDNQRTANAIGEQVGVDDVRAELLPEDKVSAVEALQREYGTVAMVGDGINDAPALATADVGVAMGAAGTDTALETADIALMADDLSRLPYLYDLSHRANGVIRQNIWVSLGAKAVLAVAVPFGLPIWAAVLFGDAGMTVGVTGNAMRLSRVRAALGATT